MLKRSSATLLDVDDSLLTRKLLLEENPFSVEQQELTQLLPDPSPYATARTIKIQPGVCVKTRLSNDSDGSKVFLNLCTSDDIPSPEDLTDQELIAILESDEPTNFKIPMSIGPLHNEKDKSGQPCSAYDIVVSPAFLEKTKDNPLFHNFFVIATIEALEQKYDVQLDKNGWTLLKNKLYYGTAPVQAVRTAMPLVQELARGRPSSKPNTGSTDLLTQCSNRTLKNTTDDSKSEGHGKITELGGGGEAVTDTLKVLEEEEGRVSNKDKHARLLSAVTTKKLSIKDGGGGDGKRRPECVVRKVLSAGGSTDAERPQVAAVTAQVKLPGMSTGAEVAVLVGEDRIVLECSSYFLDLLLPCNLRADAATAHFVTDTQTMMITVPVLAL